LGYSIVYLIVEFRPQVNHLLAVIAGVQVVAHITRAFDGESFLRWGIEERPHTGQFRDTKTVEKLGPRLRIDSPHHHATCVGAHLREWIHRMNTHIMFKVDSM
jgi:hypothetical protein